jgi:hypothetical protein
MHGVLNWVTGGLFIGERHIYMSPQVDDIFIDNDMYAGGTYRINGVDWTSNSAWQTQAHLQSQEAGVRIHMAFNGEGTTGTYFLDTLTPAADATDFQFPWINHTYSHENLDSVSYEVAYQQITRNNQVAASMGFGDYSTRALVTPDVSGLAKPSAMQAGTPASASSSRTPPGPGMTIRHPRPASATRSSPGSS